MSYVKVEERGTYLEGCEIEIGAVALVFRCCWLLVGVGYLRRGRVRFRFFVSSVQCPVSSVQCLVLSAWCEKECQSNERRGLRLR